MDSKNFTLFMVLFLIMVALVTSNFQGEGWVFDRQGKPEVRAPFTDQDYNLSLDENGIEIVLSSDVAAEYEGKYLSVYAYTSDGKHISILKRVIDGRITIGKNEAASFQTTFTGNRVTGVDKAGGGRSFYATLKAAKEEGRNFGLGRCLLGRPCVKVCPVSAVKLVRDDSPEGRGRVIPDIDFDKCILDGKCPTVCPTKLISFEGE